MRSNWKLADNTDPATNADFPFAILDRRKEVVALVKSRHDARFIQDAPGRLSHLESTASRNRRQYLGSLTSRRRP